MGDVQIGSRTVTVERFSLEKVLLIAGVVDSIMQEIPDLSKQVDEYSRAYRNTNTDEIDRSAAEFRYGKERLAELISQEAWEASGGKLRLPAEPSPAAVAGEFFPKVYAVAQEQVLRLLALVAVSQRELEQASEDGGDLPGTLKGIEKELRRADADQALDLVSIAIDVAMEQFPGKVQALVEKTKGLFPSESSQSEADSTPQGETESLPPSPEPEPDSSTSSDEPTAGIEPELSTASPSAS